MAFKPIVIESGRISKDFAYEKSRNVTVNGGEFFANYVFCEAENLEVKGGEFLGYWPLYKSIRSTIKGGKFFGNYALAEAEVPEISGGNFTGYCALHGAVNARISDGEFAGQDVLLKSKGARIIGGNFKGRGAFVHAGDLRCFLNGTIEELFIPTSGIVVARKIVDYHPIGRAQVYAGELGEKARFHHEERMKDGRNPPIKIISLSYFDREVNFDTLATALGEVEKYVIPNR